MKVMMSMAKQGVNGKQLEQLRPTTIEDVLFVLEGLEHKAHCLAQRTSHLQRKLTRKIARRIQAMVVHKENLELQPTRVGRKGQVQAILQDEIGVLLSGRLERQVEPFQENHMQSWRRVRIVRMNGQESGSRSGLPYPASCVN